MVGWFLANLLLFLYCVSPVICLVLYDVGVENGGRIFETVGVGLYILIFGGHAAALSVIRRDSSPPNTFKLPTIYVDVGLFFIQFVLTAAGVTIATLNSVNQNLSCHSMYNSQSGNSSNNTHEVLDYQNERLFENTPNPNDDDNYEFNGLCGLNVIIFWLTTLILCLRCWHLPIITKLRMCRKKKRSPTNNPLALDPRIRVTTSTTDQSVCNRDIRALTTLSGRLIIFEEGEHELRPPPIFVLPSDVAPVPSYDTVAQDRLPPPAYEP